MPRRAGKAASRRARQRAAQRGSRPAPSLPRPQADAVPPIGTPDAREAESLNPPPPAAAPEPVMGESRLSGRAQSDYHYVERDLRSIGIITLAMVAMLLVAWVVFQSLGLTT
ncbi:MAG TPA: hypothetical protein VLA76_11765 [Candidatus Angelobacter sp.]|nr:hypothetical protein [Candidatus Angelobacter sp.]